MSRLDGYHRGANFDIAVHAPGRNERQGVEPEMLRHPHRRHVSSTRLLILRDQLRKRVAIAPRPTDHYTNPHDGHAKRATSGRPEDDQPRTVHWAHHRASRRARLPARAHLRADLGSSGGAARTRKRHHWRRSPLRRRRPRSRTRPGSCRGVRRRAAPHDANLRGGCDTDRSFVEGTAALLVRSVRPMFIGVFAVSLTKELHETGPATSLNPATAHRAREADPHEHDGRAAGALRSEAPHADRPRPWEIQLSR